MPKVHRKVELAALSADADMAALQSTVLPDDRPGGANWSVEIPIDVSGPAKIYWWGICRASEAKNAATVAASGFTFDAQLVASIRTVGATSEEWISWDPVTLALPSGAPNGRGFVELDVPFAIRGYIRMISVSSPPAGGWLWLSYETSKLRST